MIATKICMKRPNRAECFETFLFREPSNWQAKRTIFIFHTVIAVGVCACAFFFRTIFFYFIFCLFSSHENSNFQCNFSFFRLRSCGSWWIRRNEHGHYVGSWVLEDDAVYIVNKVKTISCFFFFFFSEFKICIGLATQPWQQSSKWANGPYITCSAFRWADAMLYIFQFVPNLINTQNYSVAMEFFARPCCVFN